MIPALEQIIKRGGALGVKDIAFGMAHRGRLNVLAHVMAKPHRAIFHEFKGGSSSPDDADGLGRRQISPRRVLRPRIRRQQGPPVADRQSLASRDRQSGGARQDPRQAGSARRDAGRPHQRDAAPDLGRCRLRRPGRHRRVLRPVGPARPSHRRLGALHHQQPDRLYDLSALLPLVALSVRRRQDDRSADLPRQWRRSGSGGVRGQDRDRVPAEIPEAGGHRHVLLPAARAQRGRRAHVHPAADVQGDRLASDDARNLFEEADRRRRRHPGRSRQDEGDWRARLDAEFEASASYKSNKADWLDGRWAGFKVAEMSDDPRRGNTGVAIATLHDIGGKITDGAAGLPSSPHHPALPRRAPQGDRDRRGDRLVDRRGAGVLHRCCSRVTGCGCPARTASAAPSRSAIRC